jgi:hypothetical protein
MPEIYLAGHGPFLITRKIDDLMYMIKKSAKNIPKAHHVDKLRVYRGEKIPNWVSK